jgi:hypothetical protein
MIAGLVEPEPGSKWIVPSSPRARVHVELGPPTLVQQLPEGRTRDIWVISASSGPVWTGAYWLQIDYGPNQRAEMTAYLGEDRSVDVGIVVLAIAIVAIAVTAGRRMIRH